MLELIFYSRQGCLENDVFYKGVTVTFTAGQAVQKITVLATRQKNMFTAGQAVQKERQALYAAALQFTAGQAVQELERSDLNFQLIGRYFKNQRLRRDSFIWVARPFLRKII